MFEVLRLENNGVILHIYVHLSNNDGVKQEVFHIMEIKHVLIVQYMIFGKIMNLMHQQKLYWMYQPYPLVGI